jgi:hypothetical protein
MTFPKLSGKTLLDDFTCPHRKLLPVDLVHEKTLVPFKASQGSFRPIPVDTRGDGYVVVQGVNPALLFRRDTEETSGQPSMFRSGTRAREEQNIIA